MDYVFVKITDSFEHRQKKTDDFEAKVELLDTQSRWHNLLFFWDTSCVQGNMGFVWSQSKRHNLLGYEGASACADRLSTSWCHHSCAVPVLQAVRRSTEPQQRAQGDMSPKYTSERSFEKQSGRNVLAWHPCWNSFMVMVSGKDVRWGLHWFLSHEISTSVANEEKLFILLFTDDLALLSCSLHGLQVQLDCVHRLCIELGLKEILRNLRLWFSER